MSEGFLDLVRRFESYRGTSHGYQIRTRSSVTNCRNRESPCSARFLLQKCEVRPIGRSTARSEAYSVEASPHPIFEPLL
jgi:hypothetical protein